MKYLLFASALLLATSCARPPSAQPPQSEPIGADAITPDSTLAATPVKLHLFAGDSGTAPQEVVRRRLFGLLPAKKVASHKLAGSQLPRKCKGCIFNVVAGNQTVAGKKATVAAGDGAVASRIEKKAGPAIVASDSATSNNVAGPGNIQATNGNNNAPTLTAPVQQSPDWRATLAKPVGYALASVGTLLLVGGAIFLIVAYKRRKQLEV
ncbi:MAG: hypothetical protein ACRYFZ_11925 [Janthinobacterium lividum]